MTKTRILGIGVTSMVGFVVGAYAGLYLLLSLFGLSGAGFEAWTIGVGAFFALGAGVLTSVNTRHVWAPMAGVTAVIAAGGIAVAWLWDAEPEFVLGVGVLLAVALALTGAAESGRAEPKTR